MSPLLVVIVLYVDGDGEEVSRLVVLVGVQGGTA